jgi:CDP-diacylglycerol--glycerol-3-phosphate 3-phosphatidyltransferase
MNGTERMDKQTFKNRARVVLDPVVSLLASLGLSPMLVSIFGLVFSVYAGYVIATGSLFRGGLWLIVAGLCDVLDGSLARRRGVETKFGAFIDSTLDRVAELAAFAGLIIYYITRPAGFSSFIIAVVLVALGASFLISYARARLEGLGYSCKVGIMERPERLVLLIAGLLLGSRVLFIAILVLAAGATITVLQRIRHGYVVTHEREPSNPPDA